MQIYGSLIGFITAIVAIFIREWWVNRNTKKKNNETAKWLVKVFLLRELHNNHSELKKTIINGFTLGDVLEGNWGEKPGVAYEQHSMSSYNFNVNAWDKFKFELLKLDFELAKEVADIYMRFEILKEHSDKESNLSDVLVRDFKGFEEAYQNLVSKFNNV
ncbi:hypothetical protein [Brevibacillus reuszeri]|uniref:hypothetical protein n=1 Tax=Brevibacillus reuszeri TaxID=54915 RepID=UPI000CCC1F47|nr:hypothetical protein [Brevibacillus reuszeri]